MFFVALANNLLEFYTTLHVFRVQVIIMD